MKPLLKITRSIANDVWKLLFSLDLTLLSQSDKELLNKFGEPDINVGGTFLEGTADQFIVPPKYIKLVSGMPFAYDFDSTAVPFDTNIQAKVQAFQNAFVAQYVGAFTTLRTNADTFSGEFVINI